MAVCLRPFLLLGFFFLLATGPVSPLGYADDAINLVTFKRALLENDRRYFERLLPYEHILRALRHDEREIYERAPSTDVVARQKQYKFVLQYDRIAFQRSYPQLASVFESPELTKLINDNFFFFYSLGQQRVLAHNNLINARQFAQDDGVSLEPLLIEEKRIVFQPYDQSKHKSYVFQILGYDKLSRLALCTGYGPAVWDLVKVFRFEKEVDLSPVLSFLLLAQVPLKYQQLIEKDVWQAEIDKGLGKDQQQHYRQLLDDKKLKKEFGYCDKL